jgi:hypothetical protein
MMVMSRGWESKAIEQQQDAAESERQRDKTLLDTKTASRLREISALQLQRSQILNSRTSNPHRRAALQLALEQVETELRAKGVTPD